MRVLPDAESYSLNYAEKLLKMVQSVPAHKAEKTETINHTTKKRRN
jgi:hypothetical protein